MSCLPLDKASGFFFLYEKHPQSLLYNIAASMWGLLMFYLVKCLRFLPPSLANYFWSEWQYFNACKYVKRWCEPGSKTTQCFKRSHKSTMIHWQTWDFQHSDSDQSTTLFLFFYFSLVLMAVSLKPWREGGALPFYWSTLFPRYFITHPPPWNTRQNPFDSTVQNQKLFMAIHLSYMLGTTRHVLVIILC